MILVLLFGRCSPHVARDSILKLSVISKGQSLWGHFSYSAVLGCVILNQALIFAVPLPHFLSNSQASFMSQANGLFSQKPSGSPTHLIGCSYSVLPLTLWWVIAYIPFFVIAHLNTWTHKWMDPVVKDSAAPYSHQFWCLTSVRKLLGYKWNLRGNISLSSFSVDTLPFKIYFVLKYLCAWKPLLTPVSFFPFQIFFCVFLFFLLYRLYWTTEPIKLIAQDQTVFANKCFEGSKILTHFTSGCFPGTLLGTTKERASPWGHPWSNPEAGVHSLHASTRKPCCAHVWVIWPL